MLSQLIISNIAVIEHCEVNMDSGFNVLTGETGAGKSLVIDSLNMVLGERGNRELIRHGEKKAKVEALFHIEGDTLAAVSRLIDDIENGELILSRELHEDGRTVCKVNGSLVTAATLKDLGTLLVNIHGQNDGQKLLVPSNHIDYIDKYAKNEKLLHNYKTLYNEKKETEKKLDDITNNEAERLQRLDLLRYWADEIRQAELCEGEDDRLSEKRDKIKNFEKLQGSVSGAYNSLYASDGAVYEKLSGALSDVETASGYDRKLAPLSEELKDALYKIEDVSRELSAYGEGLEYDPYELEHISDRLDLIYKLKTKYGQTISDILSHLKKCEEEISLLENSEENAIELKKRLEEINDEIKVASLSLSRSRKEAAKKMQENVCRELFELDMDKVRFEVSIKEAEFLSNGCDKVEFMVSTNPIEPLKPLQKIASGGEMSRICLAIKTVLSDADDVQTLVFDEIDTGVSGKAAEKVGEKLRKLGVKKQVICITHLPQIAALGTSHYRIEKNDFKTAVNTLDESGRVEEIARIISGEQITQSARLAAREMLDKSLMV